MTPRRVEELIHRVETAADEIRVSNELTLSQLDRLMAAVLSLHDSSQRRIKYLAVPR